MALLRRLRMHGLNTEQQIERRDYIRHKTRKACVALQYRNVSERMIRSTQRQPLPGRSGPLGPEQICTKAETPAAALGDVFLQTFRRQAERELLVKIDCLVAGLIAPQRSVSR